MLGLSYNADLRGELASCFLSSPTLRSIDLSATGISALPDAWEADSQLAVLVAEFNPQLEGQALPALLEEADSLLVLDLGDSKISGPLGVLPRNLR